MAALIMQSPPLREAMGDIAEMRLTLQARTEDVADAVEHGRAPGPIHVTTLPDHERIEDLLLAALRQLVAADEAARRLAAYEPPLHRRKNSTNDSYAPHV
jgi:hypothetical protein